MNLTLVPVRRLSSFAVMLGLCPVVALVGCGGGTAEGPASSGDVSRVTTEPDAEVPEDEPEAPAGPSCDDGTCFACGDGICPLGSYCAENAPGGAACAWLAACPKEPSCACLTKELGASCTCEASAGGPHVSCN